MYNHDTAFLTTAVGFFSMSYYVNLKTNGGELIGYIQIT